MNAAARRMIGVLAGVSAVLVGSALADNATLVSRLAEAQSVAVGLESHLAGAAQHSEAWTGILSERRATSIVYEQLLDARTGFITALSGASTALTSAAGKVDTAAQLAGIRRLQDAVHAERTDPAVVTAATAEVVTTTTTIVTAVAAYDAEQKRLAEERARRAAGAGAGASTGTRLPSSGSAYDRVRAALDRVGGGGVPLEQYDGACGGVQAAACAFPAGVIRFTPALASWSNARLHWAMAHELAHIRQFGMWGSLMRSGGYASLFGSNIELLANCMAQQRGYPSGNVWCSGAQLDWSASIWGGSVPS